MSPLTRTAFAAVLLLLALPGQASALDDLKWLHRNADAVQALTTEPAECVADPAALEGSMMISLGRVAFRSPLLLGGVAARGRLSCNSCHRNGHSNPDFFLKGVSGKRGTADVTGSVFSKSRDDGIINPVPIPSLLDAQPPFGTIVPADNLDDFLAEAITAEFQGRPPPDLIVEGLKAYLGSLTASACPSGETRPVSLATDLGHVEDAWTAALLALDRKDIGAADFLLLALQGELGRIHERFIDYPAEAASLVSLSRRVGAIRESVANDPQAARRALRRAEVMLISAAISLKGREADSLYNPEVLRTWLRARSK